MAVKYYKKLFTFYCLYVLMRLSILLFSKTSGGGLSESRKKRNEFRNKFLSYPGEIFFASKMALVSNGIRKTENNVNIYLKANESMQNSLQ